MLLAGSQAGLCLAFFFFLTHFRTLYLGNSASVNNEDNPYRHVDRPIHYLRFSAQVMLGCVKLRVKTSQDSPLKAHLQIVLYFEVG